MHTHTRTHSRARIHTHTHTEGKDLCVPFPLSPGFVFVRSLVRSFVRLLGHRREMWAVIMELFHTKETFKGRRRRRGSHEEGGGGGGIGIARFFCSFFEFLPYPLLLYRVFTPLFTNTHTHTRTHTHTHELVSFRP